MAHDFADIGEQLDTRLQGAGARGGDEVLTGLPRPLRPIALREFRNG
nr:hypothetical protein [Bacillus subtilis]